MPAWGAGEYWGIVGGLLVLSVVFFVCMEILYSRAKRSVTAEGESSRAKGEAASSNSKDAA